jgi:hypothetical protein
METIANRTMLFDDIPDLFEGFTRGNISGRTVVEFALE